MNKNKTIFAIVIVMFLTIIFFKLQGKKMIYKVSNIEQLKELFPKNVNEILQRKKHCVQDMTVQIDKILNLPDDKRTFDNTARQLDHLSYYYHPVQCSIQALELLSPDKNIREACQKESLELSSFMIDKVGTNVALYKALKNYAENIAPKENLSEGQKYYLEETLRSFKKFGLDLPEDQLEKVRQLTKEIAELSLKFESNIAQSECRIPVSLDDLKGAPQEFITSLKKDDQGNYILGCDYPTYNTVMEEVAVEETRKKMFKQYLNRAYPENMEVLNKLIESRSELANLLGFESFAHLTLDNQMAKNPARVHDFLNSLLEKASDKVKKELEIIKKDLPESVKLSKSGKIQPWDNKFIKNYYKKKYLNIDEQKISEYFPMDHTIKQLLFIYEKFLSLTFKEVQTKGFWHEDVKLIEVYSKNELRGYLLLDLYPRPNKYTHAAHTTIIPSVKDCQGKCSICVGIVLANFPKPTANIPSLLKFNDVQTFFHEFGHAIHALLGCTEFYDFSGTNVKQDFVEMPSQMLEDWLKDKGIIKMVSKNYLTGEPLPDDQIEKIIDLDRFDSGDFVLTQLYYALLSLAYYERPSKVDTQAISEILYKKIRNYIEWDPETYMQASFGHLTNYGPSYYGYMWSKVFAKDLFQEIKKHGLLNPEIGQKYIQEVIGQGGSKDPNILLRNFLGRDPKPDAFMRDFGFDQ